MSGHTEGQLKVEHRHGDNLPDGGELQLWAEHRNGGMLHRECVAVINGLVTPTAHDDARRLVACWNVCIDIPTEEIERSANTTGVFGLDRDLLAALREISESTHLSAIQLRALADRAIAKYPAKPKEPANG